MGMDASFRIFAGVKVARDDYTTLRKIAATAPPGFFEAPNDPEDEYEVPDLTWDAYKGSLEGSRGLQLELYFVSEEVVGFGARVFSTDWDYSARELFLNDLARTAELTLSWMKAMLEEWGVEAEVGIYGVCDYS